MEPSVKDILKTIYTQSGWIQACRSNPDIVEIITHGYNYAESEPGIEKRIHLPDVSLWDRLCFLNRKETMPYETRVWNIFYLTLIVYDIGKVALWLNEWIDGLMAENIDELPAEIAHRLLAAKSFSIKHVYLVNPFKYAEIALNTTIAARRFDFQTIDPKLALLLKYNESAYLLWQVRGEFTGYTERSILLSEELLSELAGQDWEGIRGLRRDIHNNLGIAFGRRPAGNRADNLEISIRHHRIALESTQQETPPVGTASLLNNLGLMYRRRIRGDKAENMETSIDYLNRALGEHIRDRKPLLIAQTMTNLGVSFCDRVMGNRADNLYRAIDYYRRALKHMDPTAHAGFRSWTLHNLGVAYYFLPPGRGGINLEKAMACYRRALEFRKKDKTPLDWLLTVRNLSRAYSMRLKGNPVKNSENAIDVLDDALTVIPREIYRMEWAGTQVVYGIARAKQVGGNRAENLAKAAEHFRAALEVYEPEIMPSETREAALWLGRVLLWQERYLDAENTMRVAALADRNRYQQMFVSQSRIQEIEMGSEIYYLMAGALARQHKNLEALECLEDGKARMLAEQLRLDKAAFDRLPQAHRESYLDLTARLQALRIENYIPGRDPKLVIEDTRDTLAALNRLIGEIRIEQQDFLSEPSGFGDILPELAATGCIVEYDVTDHGTVIFLIALDEGQPVIRSYFNDGFKRGDLQRFIKNWAKRQRHLTAAASTADRKAWGDYILKRMSNLSAELFKPVENAIRELNTTGITFVPHLSLHLLPLHLMVSGPSRGKRRLLIEEYAVSYLPSLTIGSLSRRKSTSATPRQFVGISNPTLDLAGSDREIDRIKALFASNQTHILKGSEANCDAVSGSIQSAGFIHFACHARFNPDEPYRSYLALAAREGFRPDPASSRLITHTVQSDPLYLSDIYSRFNLGGHPLVVLSCCESGLTAGTDNSDEFVGFAAGFLRSGARAVVSSLWMVDDQATCELMEKFYMMIIDGASTASEALRQAQLALRDSHEFTNPFYWAAFIINGF